MKKWVEIKLRRLITRLLTMGRQPVVVTSAAVRTAGFRNPQSILILRQDRIGDVLISTPVLRELRQAFPNAQIHMLLSTNNIGASSAVQPYTDSILVYQRTGLSLVKILMAIRSKRYNIVVDVMDNPSATSTALVRFSGAKIKLGLDKANRNVYTHVVPLLNRSTVHISRRIAELLAPFGILPDAVDLRPSYPITSSELDAAMTNLGIDNTCQEIRLGVNASGSGAGRRYPPEAAARVLKQLLTHHAALRIYAFADPQNSSWLEQLSALVPVTVVAPQSSFHKAAIAMSCMDVLWTPDTSIVHLAAARSIPVCVLYVHANSELLPWFPIGTKYEALFTNTNTIADIPEADVVAALHRLCAYCDIQSGDS